MTGTGSTRVYSLQVFGDELLVGGSFITAGTTGSAYWARWRDLVTDPCPADFDGDGVVSGADLAILLGSWGPCGSPDCAGDLTCDGTVGGADLAILLGSWGPCEP